MARLANGCDGWFPAPIWVGVGIIAGKSPVVADEGQKHALAALGRSRDRAEADRARAILLTLAGWTSSRIAGAFGVRQDTVRLWRSLAADPPVVDVGRTRALHPGAMTVEEWLRTRTATPAAV